MKHHPDAVYEDTTNCISCWSCKEDQKQKNTYTSLPLEFKEKKISLKKPSTTQNKSQYFLPINQGGLRHNTSKTARFSTNSRINLNPDSLIDFPVKTHPVTDRMSHEVYVNYEELPQKICMTKGRANRQSGNTLNETAKFQGSNPISLTQMFKTRKNSTDRKASFSFLKGIDSVHSFAENYQVTERLQESQVLYNHFNPTQSQFNQIKSFVKRARRDSYQLPRIQE